MRGRERKRGRGKREREQEKDRKGGRERESQCKLVLFRLNKLESEPGEGLIKVNRQLKVRKSSVSMGEKNPGFKTNS